MRHQQHFQLRLDQIPNLETNVSLFRPYPKDLGGIKERTLEGICCSGVIARRTASRAAFSVLSLLCLG